jgi:hypothetical protein
MPFQAQMPLKLTGAKAGAGLTAASVQYKWVKMSADQTVVLCDGATDKPIGVLQAPVSATGQPVDVVVIGETQIQADASLSAGQGIGAAADGQAAHYEIGAGSNTKYVAGTVVNVAGGTTAGNLITAVIDCVNPPLGG